MNACLSFLIAAAIPFSIAQAQGPPPENPIEDVGVTADDITLDVVAKRAKAAPPGQTVTSLSREDLAASTDTADALLQKNILSLTRTGGPGGFVTAFPRGAPSGQLLVIRDGLILNDPSSFDARANLSLLPSWELGKVDMVYGPATLLFGPTASGGALVLSSRTSERPRWAEAQFLGGSATTFSESIAMGRSSPSSDVTVGAQRWDRRGWNSSPQGSEPDGVHRTHIFSSVRSDTRVFSIPVSSRLSAGYLDAHSDLDDAFGSTITDNAGAKLFERGIWVFGSMTANEATSLSVGFHGARTRFEDGGLGSRDVNNGQSAQWAARTRIQLVDPVTLSLAWDGQADTVNTESNFSGNARYGWATTGGVAVLEGKAGATHLAAGARVQGHPLFGTHEAVSFGATLPIPFLSSPTAASTLGVSLGNGFKHPSLSQVYGFGANRDLAPERSWDIQADFKTQLREKIGGATTHAEFSLAGFYSSYDNLIAFGSGIFGPWINRDAVTSLGIDASLKIQRGAWDTTFQFLWNRVRAAASDLQLPRRAEFSGSVGVDRRLGSLWKVGARLRSVSRRFDRDGSPERLAPYTTLDVSASVTPLRWMTLALRVDNVFNVPALDAAGYTPEGLSALASLTVRWDDE